MKKSEWLMLGIGGAVAFYLIWLAEKGREKAADALDAVAGAIAWPIIQVRSWFQDEPRIPGYMLLPDQRAVPLNDTHVNKVPNKEQYTFRYEGVNYEVIGRTDTGNYVARRL